MFVVDAVGNDSRLLEVLLLTALIVALVVLAGRIALNLLRSRHHPILAKGDVFVRDVDHETAQVWASLDPKDAIKISLRGDQLTRQTG